MLASDHCFSPFIENPQSLTYQAAQAMGVDPKDFANWRWQMGHQIQKPEEMSVFFPLEDAEEKGFSETEHLFLAGLTPYYAGLACLLPPDGRKKIRLQSLPRKEETLDPFGLKDPLDEKAHSPVPEVVHVYPDRVAFCVAMLCPVYCRYCYRKRRDEEEGLHYNRNVIEKGLAYIRSNPAIRDVLITGGDPLIASDSAIEKLLIALRAIPHVEIIRIGTRTPVTLPYRITDNLVKILERFHPLWLNTHFNCKEELTPEALFAVDRLLKAGIPVGNQSVLLKGVNDSPEDMLALCQSLIRGRIRPYYVFHPHLVAGTEHLRVSLARGLKIMKSLRGKISGFGIPSYIMDTPSGKIPLGHPYVLGQDGEDLLLEDLHGAIWREKGAFREEWQPF